VLGLCSPGDSSGCLVWTEGVRIYNWGGNLGDYENVAIYYFHEVNK